MLINFKQMHSFYVREHNTMGGERERGGGRGGGRRGRGRGRYPPGKVVAAASDHSTERGAK